MDNPFKKKLSQVSAEPVDPRAPLKLPSFFRLSLQEQMMFAKRLAILLKAGVPILGALKMMQKQTTAKNSLHVVTDLANGVERGQFLHVRLDRYRKFFGDFAVNIVKVGEVSGTLHENLGYLSDELKKQKELRSKVIGALVYPIFIVVATLGITILLTVYVFPKILPILTTFNTQLPFSTRALIFISSLFIHWGWLITIIVLALIALFVLSLRKKPHFALFIDRGLLKIPVLGKLLQSYNMANFCRTLGILLQSDVRIVEAISITATTSTNLVYRDSLLKLGDVIKKGGKISAFLEEEGKIYPPMVYQMVHVGESTGKLSDSLAYLAEIYENEVDDLTKNLSTSIEPLLMIFMGLMVGFIAVSIITPIYSFTQNLNPYK
jgi:type IV pilus assembly protein PilC